MAKITLDTITSAYASTSLFQSNFTAIATELNDKVLYRNNPAGEANQMENDLDMNSNDILNVDAIDVTSLTVNGTAITPNTNDQTLTYIDTEFTTQAGQDTFLAAYTVGFVDVYYNGVLMATADYTASNGTSVVLASTVVDNADVITIRSFSAFSAGDGITQTVADARYLLEANNLSDLNSASTSRTNLGLGTAAVENVQTSSTDTTADALMAVGAFGLGAALGSTGTLVTDLNDVGEVTRFVWAAGTATNAPSTSSGWHVLHMPNTVTGFISQVAYSSDSPVAMYFRINDGGTWSAWQPVYTGANYQPETIGGIGVVQLMQNASGGNQFAGNDYAGSLLRFTKFVAGVPTADGTPVTSVWKYLGNSTLANLDFSMYVRKS